MEKATSQNIQDAFLNSARRDKSTIIIHLLNGTSRTGRIRSFDKFSIMVDAGDGDHLVFKHAISSIATERLKNDK